LAGSATSLSGRYIYINSDILDVNVYLDIISIFRIVHSMNIKSSRILVDLPRELLRAVEDYRYSQRIPSRAEALRRLIEKGLESTLSDEPGAPTSYDPGPPQKVKT